MSDSVKPRSQIIIDTSTSYYDQVIGMSQGIINRSFKAIFEKAKKDGGKVARMNINREEEGSIHAEMDAPSVIIMGASDESARIFYLLRLKSGTATMSTGEPIDLAGWSFAVETPLRQTVLSELAGDTEAEKEEKRLKMQMLGEKYRGFVPGDYRVQRVFCALAEAKWENPDGAWSTAVVKGKSMKMFEWRKDNPDAYDNLNELLRYWAKAQRDPTITSMGLKFELNPEKKYSPDPTFRPVHVVMQTYPYRTNSEKLGSSGLGSYEQDGNLVGGDYNCLMYCEMVDSKNLDIFTFPEYKARALPGQTRLTWSANFAEPNGPYGEIPGSFVMDRHVFMESFLLPQLQELCMATRFSCGSAQPYDKDGTHYSLPVWALGQSLPGEPAFKASDTSFKFERKSTGHYQWRYPSSSPNNGDAHQHYAAWYQRNCFSRVENSSVSTVDVRWVEGETLMTVQGSVVYNFKVQFAHNREMDDDVHELYYTVTCKWGLNLALLEDINHQFIRLEFDTSKFIYVGEHHVPEDFSVFSSNETRSRVAGGDVDVLKESMAWNLANHISSVQINLTEFFQKRGTFVYPGHGSLNFTKPMLTAEGSLVAVAEYAPVNDDGTVSFPDETVNFKKPTESEQSTTKLPAVKNNIGIPKLDWDMNFRYDHSRKIGWLEFTVKNKDHNTPVRLERLTVKAVPPAGKGIPARLFPALEWHPQHESLLLSWLSLIRNFTVEAVRDWFSFNEQEVQKPDTAEKPTAPSSPDQGRRPKDKTLGEKTPIPGAGEQKVDHKDSVFHLRPDNVYACAYSSDWNEKKDLNIRVRPQMGDLGVSFTVAQRKNNQDLPFEIAPKKSITIAVQGKVPGPGQYMVLCEEEWASADGEEKDTQEEWNAQAWKFVSIDSSGDVDYFDVAKRLSVEKPNKP